VVLRRGDSGPRVKALQRSLNKLGSMLLIDGDFGLGTRDAVVDARHVLHHPGLPEADAALQRALDAVPDPCPPLGAPGVTFIARAEVSGPREYRRKYTNPVWPSVRSGITIGIGYDLQFTTRAQLHADWRRLPIGALNDLQHVLGVPGSVDRLASVRHVVVPLLDAMAVFLNRTLPRFLQLTRSIYPRVDALPAARQAALVSLVYNRGTRLDDRNPLQEERREMRAIQALLAAGSLDEVDDQFEEMTRLWDANRLPGLIQRRRDEAKLWRSGFEALQLL
jgi:sirohydrochlorin ferrochelatase